MLKRHPAPQFDFKARPGFTLVELLVVIAIILILAGLVFGVASGVSTKQARSKAETEMATIAMALESYKLKHGDYPWLNGDAPALYKHLTGRLKMQPSSTPGSPKMDAEGDGDPYLDASKMSTSFNDGEEYFVDPWGQAYKYYYKRPGGGFRSWPYAGFILVSGGPDVEIDDSGLSSGKINADHFSEEKNADNIVYGMDY